MDLGAAVDRLYGLPRQEFVAERDKLAKAQPALADAIRKLRKPTVAAWQANQLARNHKKDVAALVAVGRDMRTAQETLDGPALRKLSRQRIEALDKLVGRLPDAATGLRELLERAIADPDAAEDLLAGRMVTEPAGGGWGFDVAMPAPDPERDEKRRRESEETRRRQDETRQREERRQADEKRQQADEKRRQENEKRRQENEKRRRAEEARRREHEEAKAAEAEAQQELATAEAELEARTRRVDELHSELADARAARDEAAGTVRKARRRAEQASAAVRRLGDS